MKHAPVTTVCYPADGALHALVDLGQDWEVLTRVWIGQIETARTQMESAIVALTREFAGIVEELKEMAVLAQGLGGDAACLPVAGEAGGEQVRAYAADVARAAEMLDRRSRHIQASVDSSLTNLQFQDRINQILSHVQASIRLLGDAIKEQRAEFERCGRIAPIDFTDLLRRIEKSYSTLEEKAAHHGRFSTEDIDSLTFF